MNYECMLLMLERVAVNMCPSGRRGEPRARVCTSEGTRAARDDPDGQHELRADDHSGSSAHAALRRTAGLLLGLRVQVRQQKPLVPRRALRLRGAQRRVLGVFITRTLQMDWSKDSHRSSRRTSEYEKNTNSARVQCSHLPWRAGHVRRGPPRVRLPRTAPHAHVHDAVRRARQPRSDHVHLADAVGRPLRALHRLRALRPLPQQRHAVGRRALRAAPHAQSCAPPIAASLPPIILHHQNLTLNSPESAPRANCQHPLHNS